jgi:hypothetical protein
VNAVNVLLQALLRLALVSMRLHDPRQDSDAFYQIRMVLPVQCSLVERKWLQGLYLTEHSPTDALTPYHSS